MKELRADVTIKKEHIEQALASPKFLGAVDGNISIEKAQQLNIFHVDDMDTLLTLAELLNLLSELRERNLDLVDSVTIPVKQLKYLEAILTY